MNPLLGYITRDEWIKNYQNPFDEEMKRLPDYSPEELQLVQEYQDALRMADPETQKGAMETALQYYPGYGFNGTPLSPLFSSPSSESGMDLFAPSHLEAPERVSEMFSPEFRDQFFSDRERDVNAIGDLFGPSTQIDLSNVPQPSAALMDESGYDPSILAQMRSRATEDRSNAGINQMAAAKRALGLAGLGDSGASSSIMEEIARQTGDATTADLRDIDITNANVGLENKRMNIASLNAMAMENASRLFSAMSQNAANSMSKAGAQTSAYQNATNTYQNAAVNRANNAAFQNQQSQQRTNELNFGAGEDRWRTALSTLTNFSNPSFPNAPASGGSALGSLLSNVGSSFLDTAISSYPWGKAGS